jgi:protein-disulfide isomerase
LTFEGNSGRIVDMPKALENSPVKSLIEKIVPALLVLCVGLAFVVGVLWERVSKLEKGGTTSAANTTTTTTGATQPKVTLSTIKDLFGKDIIKFGDANRKVLFVEMADPSCPYCHAADGQNHTIYKSLGATFQLKADGGSYISPVSEMKNLVDSGQASYVYIFYPGHGNGEMGMKALYCANEKGKFWDAQNLLMSDAGYTLMNTTVQNDKTKSGVLADFLKNVIDPTFMKSCLDSGKYDARLTSDQALATSLGVQGTPGFYVNATSFPGAYGWTDMKSTVDAALKYLREWYNSSLR